MASEDGGRIRFEKPRRSDRAVEDREWIQVFLEQATTGVLATAVGGEPHLNVNLFVYDRPRRSLYVHTARRGATRESLAASGPASFLIHRVGRFLPAQEALEFSVEYASVVVVGEAAVIGEPERVHWALSMLLEKYFPHLTPGVDFRPITKEEMARTTVIELKIESWSAKMKSAPEQAPGAFLRQEPGFEQFSRQAP